MKSQSTTRRPIVGIIFFTMLMLIIWAVDAAIGLPLNIIEAAILATVFSSLAVAL